MWTNEDTNRLVEEHTRQLRLADRVVNVIAGVALALVIVLLVAR